MVGNRTVSGRHEDFEMRLIRNDASAVMTTWWHAHRLLVWHDRHLDEVTPPDS
ncbi:MAG: hypothetical protein H7Z40_23005 [Phycisphaerae bacterium]|nr:hypothetical protein [Gemmatimonadaceae bacterium]